MKDIRRVLKRKMANDNLRGVENPSDGVVDGFRLGECLMAAFMRDNPETGRKETDPEAVHSPQRKTSGRVKKGMGQGNGIGIDEGVRERCGFIAGVDNDQVHHTSRG